MSIEFFILKTWRYLSLIAAVVFLFLKYYALPDMVAVYFSKQAISSGFLPKDQFFYLFATLLLVINIFPSLLIAPFKKLPPSTLPSFLKKYSGTAFLNETFENWINLIIGSVNSILIVSLLILSKINSTEYHTNINDYNWFSTISFIGFILLLVYPFVKIKLFAPKSENFS
jgi:hypothetical protein